MAWSVIETILALVAAGVTGTNAVAANAPDFVTNEAAFFVVDLEQDKCALLLGGSKDGVNRGAAPS